MSRAHAALSVSRFKWNSNNNLNGLNNIPFNRLEKCISITTGCLKNVLLVSINGQSINKTCTGAPPNHVR